MKRVEIEDEIYFVRKFSTGEYLRAKLSGASEEDGLVGTIALGLANEDGSRKFPAGDKEVTDESRQAILDLPLGYTIQLASEIASFNGLDAKPKK